VSPDRSVSVVIATRDRPELLRRALAGIWTQEHPAPLEVVVVHDRSEPDHSLERSDGDRCIRVVTNERTGGLAGARNTGVAAARGSWVAFCDDDDEWLPGKLRAQFDALERTPGADVAVTGIVVRFDGSDTVRIPDPARLTYHGFLRDRMTEVHPSSILVSRRAFVDEIGEVDESLPGSYAEDYDWLLRAASVSTIAVAPEPLVRVWWHAGSYFGQRWATIDAALDHLVSKHPGFEDEPSGLARILGQRALAQAALGRRRDALRTIRLAVRANPFEKRIPVALLVAAGLPPQRVMAAAHRVGRGI
jgi:glycosyltransferase involved in cell wall biosynthesis